MSYIDVVKRETGLFKNQPLIWVIMVVLPLALCFLICTIFTEGSPRNLPVAIIDSDNSELSRLFVRNIQALPSCNISFRPNNLLEGKNLLTEGKIYALVVIPKDFQSDIYRMKTPKTVLYFNNQMILIGGIVSKDITTVVKTMMVGIDAKSRSKRGIPLDKAIEQANPVVVDDHVRSNPYLNYQYFLSLTSFGHILQILILMVSLWAFGIEFKRGTSKKWLECADNSILIAVLGKITPYFFIFTFVFAIIYFFYFIVYDAPFTGDVILVTVSSLVFIFTCLSLGIVFLSINGNFRYGLSNAAFYSAMGFAFAGITFPVMSMPLFAKIYSASLPLSHYIKIMINQAMREIPVEYDIKNIIYILIICSIAYACLPRLKKLANDESRWYQE